MFATAHIKALVTAIDARYADLQCVFVQTLTAMNPRSALRVFRYVVAATNVAIWRQNHEAAKATKRHS